jgi:hypothetical protein
MQEQQEKTSSTKKFMKGFVRILANPSINLGVMGLGVGICAGALLYSPLAANAAYAAPILIDGMPLPSEGPQKSLLQYVRSYGSISSWVDLAKRGRPTKEFTTYVVRPLVKSIVPITCFGLGALAGGTASALVFDKIYLRDLTECYVEAQDTLVKFKQILENTEPFL